MMYPPNKKEKENEKEKKKAKQQMIGEGTMIKFGAIFLMYCVVLIHTLCKGTVVFN